MKGRLLLLSLLLALGLPILWAGRGRPPIHIFLHGTGGPTGRTRTVAGVRLVELSAGGWRTDGEVRPRLRERLAGSLGLGPVVARPWSPWRLVEWPVWIATTETTNAELERAVPGRRRLPCSLRDDQPAVGVTPDEAVAYCRWLTERGGGLVFRTPTATEWEYAARAGGPGVRPAAEVNAGGKWAEGPAPPGGRAANPWGLLDMAGGVTEACRDGGFLGTAWYHGSGWAAHTDLGTGAAGGYLAGGLRVVAEDGGHGPDPTPPPFPLDRWHLVAKGRLAALYVERALYRPADESEPCLRFAVENLGNGPIGLDLRDENTVPHPNQWGGLEEPERGFIHEERLLRSPVSSRGIRELLGAFAAGELLRVPAGGTGEFLSRFTGDSAADLEEIGGPILFVSIDGWLPVTDGEEMERLDAEDLEDPLLLLWPAPWRPFPEGIRIVGRDW